LYGDDPFNAGWLLAVTATLREHEDWGLGINNIPHSYVLIFQSGGGCDDRTPFRLATALQ